MADAIEAWKNIWEGSLLCFRRSYSVLRKELERSSREGVKEGGRARWRYGRAVDVL
jgi:hypothetical protein